MDVTFMYTDSIPSSFTYITKIVFLILVPWLVHLHITKAVFLMLVPWLRNLLIHVCVYQ